MSTCLPVGSHKSTLYQFECAHSHTCSSAVGGYSPGLRSGLGAVTVAPFDGTSEAMPAAADSGFETLVAPRDSPALPAAGVFTSVLVPAQRAHDAKFYEPTRTQHLMDHAPQCGLNRRDINAGNCTPRVSGDLHANGSNIQTTSYVDKDSTSVQRVYASATALIKIRL